jgi:hypothetical protein
MWKPAPKDDIVTAADLYRREAAKADALAENFQDAASRDQLRKIAKTYRRLATNADTRAEGGDASAGEAGAAPNSSAPADNANP